MIPDELPPTPAPEGNGSIGASLPVGLPPERLDALRAAIGDWARDGGGEPGALQALLREVSAEARRRGIPAERLLVDLKLVWYALPEVRALRTPRQGDALAEFVTLCIRAYYAPGAPSPSPPA